MLFSHQSSRPSPRSSMLAQALGPSARPAFFNLPDESDVEVTSVACRADAVAEEALFVCTATDGDTAAPLIEAAVEAGAYAVLVSDIPSVVAALRSVLEASSPDGEASSVAGAAVPDALSALPRLFNAFYEDPSATVGVVAVLGSARAAGGAAHLLRSVLDAASPGTVASLGPAGYECGGRKLDGTGRPWVAEEEDPTAERRCSAAAWLAPYRGKYPTPRQPPDGCQYAQLLAGCVDLGARFAVVHLSPSAVLAGACDALRLRALVVTEGASEEAAMRLITGGAAAAAASTSAAVAGDGGGAAADDGAPPPDGAPSSNDASFVPSPAAPRSHMMTPFELALCTEHSSYSALAAAAASSFCVRRMLPFSGDAVASFPETESGPPPDVKPFSVDLGLWDTLMTIVAPPPHGEVAFKSAAVGLAAVRDASSAVAVASLLSLPLAALTSGVDAAPPPPGAMELVDRGQAFAVFVDGAKTAADLEAALRTARDLGALHVLCVVGAASGTSRAERAALGRAAHAGADVVFVTTDSPGSEDPYDVLADVVAGFDGDVYSSAAVKAAAPRFAFLKDYRQFWPELQPDEGWEAEDPWAAMQWQTIAKRFVIADRFSALRAAIGMAGEGDAVVIAGRGASDVMVVQGRKHWFDDGREARAALDVLRHPEKGVPLTLDLRVLPIRGKEWEAEVNDYIGAVW